MGLLAAAVAIAQFLPELAVPGLRNVLATLVGLLAILTSCAGLRRWGQVDRAIRRGLPLPRSAIPTYLVVALVLVGVVAVGLAVTSNLIAT